MRMFHDAYESAKMIEAVEQGQSAERLLPWIAPGVSSILFAPF